MAAYGLSVLADDQLSFFDLDGLSDAQKAEAESLSDWRNEVLLDAYKSLVFAQKLRQVQILDSGKQSGKRLVDFSALGQQGQRSAMLHKLN